LTLKHTKASDWAVRRLLLRGGGTQPKQESFVPSSFNMMRGLGAVKNGLERKNNCKLNPISEEEPEDLIL
jgi:hypothetical protein